MSLKITALSEKTTLRRVLKRVLATGITAQTD
jgi:hypothetical protein